MFASSGALAQDALEIYDPLRVSIKPISFDPLTDDPVVPGTYDWEITDESTLDADYVIVNLSSNFVTSEWFDDLEALGATVVAAYPPRSYAVRIPPTNEEDLAENSHVRWLGPYLPGYRVPAEVAEAESGGDYIDLELILFAGEDPDDYLSAISTLVSGIIIGDVHEPHPSRTHASATLIVSVPAGGYADALESLAGLEALETMETWVEATAANDTSVGWLQTSSDDDSAPDPLDTNAPAFKAGISGLGETIAVADSGLENDMCFFRWGPDAASTTQGERLDPPEVREVDASKKVVAYYWNRHDDTDYDSATCTFHGTHVAGTAAGDTFDDVSVTPNPAFLAKDDNLASNEVADGAFSSLVDHHQAADGMAPGAQLLIQDIVDNAAGCGYRGGLIFARHFQAYFSTDAQDEIRVRHHTNSWGSGVNVAPPRGRPYSDLAAEADEFSWFHRDFNVFFCAGNEADWDDDGEPDASRIRRPAEMKNAVTVGNSGNPDRNLDPSVSFGNRMSSDSSHGPAAGVRIKPDLSAPGFEILSAGPVNELPATGLPPPAPQPDFDCDTRRLSGTSMATPAVAGLSALLRQYIREGRYPDGVADAARGFSPTSALIKALLVNSTRSVWDGVNGQGENTADFSSSAAHRPTMGQGWGRPVLNDIIDFGPSVSPARKLLILTDTPNGLTSLMVNDGRRRALPTFRASMQTGRVHEFPFVVTVANQPLHVTLAWADPKGFANAAVPLINDLDMELIDPAGKVWRPEPGAPGPNNDPSNEWPFGQQDESLARLWSDGFSILGLEANNVQEASPPFSDFAGRDERNNVENVFVRPGPWSLLNPNGVRAGTWRARVIFYDSAAAPAPLSAAAYPNLVSSAPGEPCVDDADRDCDWATTTDQGYALIVSGAVELPPVPVVGAVIVRDGCEFDQAGGQAPDGRLDFDELVNLRIPVTTAVARDDVKGCLYARGGTVDHVQIGDFAPDLGGAEPTACSVFGDMAANSTAEARFTIMLDAGHPAPPAPALFRLDLWQAAALDSTGGPHCSGMQLVHSYDISVPLDPAPFQQTGFNPTPGQPGKGGCAGMSADDPDDPSVTAVDANGDTVLNDIFIEYCPSSNSYSIANNYNLYRGVDWDCPERQWDHVAKVVNTWCNLQCNDDQFAIPESTLDGRCEVLLLDPQFSPNVGYFTISGEHDCGVSGRGAEGAFRICGDPGCEEIPYGGGVCP